MPSSNDTRPRTVVLLQYAGIGDLVWHIPYFKLIADQSQDGRVTVVAQPSTLTRAFIGKEPWVEEVIDHDHRPRRGEKRRGKHAGFAGMWRMAQQLKAGRFDRIVLFSGRPSRGLVAWLSGIRIRQGDWMGRPGLLVVDIPRSGGIIVSGTAVPCAASTMSPPSPTCQEPTP